MSHCGFERVENPSDKDPHFPIYAAGAVELGAAWQKHSEETGRDDLPVKLNDPSFSAPVPATLTEVEGEMELQLIWSTMSDEWLRISLTLLLDIGLHSSSKPNYAEV